MRRIEELLHENKSVWFYLKNHEMKRNFVDEINKMGGHYINGEELTVDNCYHIMAVHGDWKVAQVMILIWNSSFGDQCSVSPLKVDYEKFKTGSHDWECTESEFIPLNSM